MTRMLTAEPQLFVTDMTRSLGFFTGSLGFDVVFTYGNPPFYAQVRRDEARLNLRHVDAPVIDAGRRDREELLAASIPVDDADPLFQAWQAAGVPFFQAMRREIWGARTFIVRDPDGNLILFAGPDRPDAESV